MTDISQTTLVIPRRFCGPDQSANGGYCSGLLAAALAGDSGSGVEVRLQAPPPLDTPLQLRCSADSAELLHGSTTVAVARLVDPPIVDAPCSCGHAVAERAATNYVGHQHHPYPHCFVCGPQRAADDGLRIFAGHIEPEGQYAAPWRAGKHLVDADGQIGLPMIWAALDCPSYFALGKPGLPALLGNMSAAVQERPRVNEDCVLMAWSTGSEGRKHGAASVLYGDDGRVLAQASTLWIELRQPVPTSAAIVSA